MSIKSFSPGVSWIISLLLLLFLDERLISRIRFQVSILKKNVGFFAFNPLVACCGMQVMQEILSLSHQFYEMLFTDFHSVHSSLIYFRFCSPKARTILLLELRHSQSDYYFFA